VTRRWVTGLVVGAVAGAGTLLAGPIAGMLGLVAIILAVAGSPRAAAIGGVLIGLGLAWLTLLGRVALTCREDCVGPGLEPWLLAAGVLAGLGLVVTIRARRPA
jgi:hypothetical protein